MPSDHPTARRSRKRLRYQGRSYGTPVSRPRPKREGPSKREQAADEALAAILEMFESDSLPERIAETVIARQESDSPMVGWSLGNQLLCLLAGTTDARGYRQWQEVGRHVEKGARAVYILAPKTRKIAEKDSATGEESERVITTGFLGIPVFRYEDTDGFSIERPDYRPAEFPPLFHVAERFGLTVDYGPFAERFLGVYQHGEGRILLCSHDVRVFFHELAHAAHYRACSDVSTGEGQRKRKEIVAELTAAVLCQLYGFESFVATCRDYIASYSDGKPGRAALKVLAEVQATLLLILEGEEIPVRAAA